VPILDSALIGAHVAGAWAQVLNGLNDFCAEHLLHWIEVLSLTRTLHVVRQAMSDLMLEVVVRCLTP
jgi:hypothetical protein